MADKKNRIAFQGQPGAYSDLACRNAYPGMETLPCASFEDAFAAVKDGRAKLAMIPIENSVAGRVADVHHLMPHSKLKIVAEHFQRVNHHLLAPKGATLKTLKKGAATEEQAPEPIEGGEDEQPADSETKGKTVPVSRPSELLEAVLAAGRKGLSIQRYKGLGEMNAEQLWETTLDRANRSLLRVEISQADVADEIFTRLMGDIVEPRREFIQENALSVANLDV